MKRQLTLLTFSFFAIAASGEMDSEPRDTIPILSSPCVVAEGETTIVDLPKDYFVRKLFIQAESANSRPAYMEVSVNGDVKGTLYLPGSDPHYVVTVERKTGSIEFTSVTGRSKLISVKAVVSETGLPDPLPFPTHSKMGKFSLDTIWVTEQLDHYTTYEDYGKYLLPIRKKAGLTYAIAEAQGDLSGSARPYYEQFLAVLDFATPYLNKMFEIEEAYELTLRLMSIRERVRELLD